VLYQNHQGELQFKLKPATALFLFAVLVNMSNRFCNKFYDRLIDDVIPAIVAKRRDVAKSHGSDFSIDEPSLAATPCTPENNLRSDESGLER
jgi:hypothetical protein